MALVVYPMQCNLGRKDEPLRPLSARGMWLDIPLCISSEPINNPRLGEDISSLRYPTT